MSKKGETLKELLKREREEQEVQLKKECETLAKKEYGDDLAKWSNANKGLWYLPITDPETGKILALGIMKPITRTILSYASTKIQEEGLYEFLEAAMRACWIAGDEKILDEDDYFIPASQKFNKMMEGYNASLLKR